MLDWRDINLPDICNAVIASNTVNPPWNGQTRNANERIYSFEVDRRDFLMSFQLNSQGVVFCINCKASGEVVANDPQPLAS